MSKIEFCKGLLYGNNLLLLCVIICLGEFRNDLNAKITFISNQGFRGIKVTITTPEVICFILLLNHISIVL